MKKISYSERNSETTSKITKVVISCLVVLFTLTSVPQTFAQEAEAPVSTEPVITDPEIILEDPVEPVPADEVPKEPAPPADQPKRGNLEEKLKQKDPEPEALQAVGPISQIDDIAPSDNRLTPQVDNITGALVYNYGISVPPGRNSMTPDVFLTYSSAQAVEDSVVGSGWSINIPVIQRINRKGTNSLYSENYFSSSMDGELISTGGSTYAAKDENGNFLTYSLSGSVWTVTDKAGTVYKFGANAAERQDHPTDTSKVFKWMLQEVRDTNDNYVKYEYYKEAGQIYPSKITYTGNGSTDGVLEVNFERVARTNAPIFYNTGFPVQSNYQISEIRTEVNNIWARKYALSYTAGDNGLGSFLDTITESGQDDSSNIVSLPAVNFNYNTATTDWSYNSSIVMPLPFTDNGSEYGMRTADINGDGLLDIVCHNNSNNYACQRTTPTIYLNNGNGGWTDVSSTWSFPVMVDNSSLTEAFLDGQLLDTGLRVIDVNGDLKADLVRGDESKKYVYLNNGVNGWVYNPSWSLPLPFRDAGNDSGMRMGDINGDGLPDIVCHTDKTSGVCNKNNPQIYLHNGSGWTDVSTSWLFPIKVDNAGEREGFLNSSLQDKGMRLVDVNGDNLADLVRALGNDRFTYINNGSGWTYTSSWNMPYPFLTATSPVKDTGLRMGDINGDGLPDIVCHDHDNSSTYCPRSIPRIMINKGTGWNDETTAWEFPAMADDPTSKEAFIDATTDRDVRLLDINGDGIDDLVRGYGSTHRYSYTNNEDVQTNLLTEIIHPQGGSTTIVYKATPLFKDGANNILNPKVPIISDVVYQVSNNDGLGLTATSTYEYEGGEYYFNTALDRKFSGFNKVTKTNNAGHKTVNYFHQGNSTDSANGEYSDHISKIGKPYRTEIKDSSGNVYGKTINKWDRAQIATDRNFVKLTQSLGLSYDGDLDHKDKAITYTYSDSNGNVTEVIDWGEVTGADVGTFTDVGTDKLTTTYSYAVGGSIVGLPSQEITIDQNANKVRETKSYYDALALGSVSDGNLTKQEMWKDGANYVDIEKTYNTTYGIVTQEKDPRDKITSYSYEANNLYPATVTNALSQATNYLYDYSLGKPKQVTDINSRVFQTVYDGLDRVKEEKQPDLTTPSTLVTKSAYNYTDTSGSVKIQQTDYLDASTSVDTHTYYDGLLRPVQVRKEMEDGNFAVIDTVYNNFDQVQKESLPYSSAGVSKTSPTTNADLLTTYNYDPLLRVTSAANILGTITNTYDDWKHSITDLRGKTKHYYKDSRGNLVTVEEINSGNTYTTNYEYNGNDKLTKITDALSNVRNFTYDGLGRTLTAQDLHASADSTFGTWSYAHDANGNIISVVDPKNQTINYTYDDLNRPSTEDYTGQAGTEVSYSYDSGTDGIGRLTSVTAPEANTTYVYNSHGAVQQEAKTINSVGYSTSYTYDRQGNTLEITNPDSSKVKYTYNTAGQLETVQRKESTDGGYVNVITDFDYGPHGKVTYQAFQNGSATTNTYDNTKLYRLGRKQTTAAASTTVVFYPTAGDGQVQYDNANWDTAHDAATGSSTSYSSASFYVGTGKVSSTTYRIRRGFIPFNTASLPDGANITSAKLKVYVTSKLNNDNDGDDWLTVVQSTQPSTTVLTTADYDLAGSINNPTEGIDTPERKDITNISTGAYLTFNLNATGLGWVNKTGATKLALREGHDVIDSAFTGSSGQHSYVVSSSSEATGTSNDPILEVTYSNEATLQDLTYTYDNNGNITRIVDASTTNSSKTVDYTYDDLNRLLSATASAVAPGQSTYSHTYTYNAIGNILTRTDSAGSYSYGGDQGANYANPHAVTSVGSVTYTYDNNGNMLSESGGLSNTWDYNNRLSQAVKSGVTSTYGYDHAGQRVKLANGSATNYYPSRFYNTDGTTPVKHIFAGDSLVATVKGTGASAAVYSDHTDHLAGSNAITNSSGNLEELLDYFPYGNMRLDQKAGSFDEQRKFTGHEYDVGTGLNYMKARYYNPGIGRFLSQDPAFTNLTHLQVQLADPQSWNSYSYARNNPLAFVDPNGNMWTPWQSSGGFGNWMGNGGFLRNIYGSNVDSINNTISSIQQSGWTKTNVMALGADAASITAKTSGVVLGSVGLGMGAGAATNVLTPAAVSTAGTAGTACASGGCDKAQRAATTVYNDAVIRTLTKYPNANLPTRAGVIKNFDFWTNTNFPSKTDSMLYHAAKHGELNSLTSNAHNVWNSYVSNQTGVVRDVLNYTLKNGEAGIRVRLNDGSGGIFNTTGKIISSWKK